MSGDAIKIHIMDKEYLVACPEEERDALLASAKMLNDKMSVIRESGKVVGIDRIAVMAALNLAHGLIASGSSAGDIESYSERIRLLSSRIGEALDSYKIAGLN